MVTFLGGGIQMILLGQDLESVCGEAGGEVRRV